MKCSSIEEGSDMRGRAPMPESEGKTSRIAVPLTLITSVFTLAVYFAAGWLFLSIVGSVLGDPMTFYLESMHNDALRVASAIFFIGLNALVGLVVLRCIRYVIMSAENEHVEMRLQRLRELDPMWDEDVLQCTEIMRKGSKSFFLASWLLPSWVREPALALYSFCRKADDDIDEGSIEGAQDRLKRLHQRLDDAYNGVPQPNCVDRAFSAVVRAFEIPKEMPEALLDGFLWDLSDRRYETLSDVIAYSSRVASSVGGMMTVLMGGKDSVTFARAFDLGVAMQLTNIARDVGEDARNGRVYLPADLLAEEGLTPEELKANPTFSPALGRVVQKLLHRADELYERADSGISMLPRSCRVAIRAARLIYCEIGRKLELRACNSIASRAVVGKKHKVALALRALPELVLWDRARNTEPVLPECEYLLRALDPSFARAEKLSPDALV